MNIHTQTKPARRLGADITQGTLQKTLDQAGIEKSIANLSYAEKRLVIVASLLTQVKEATNDWGKTIESPANQTRILSEQWERLTRTVGNIFLPIVYKILPYVNAILMVLTEIAQIIADIVGKLFGFSAKDLDFGVGTANDAVVDLSDSLGTATDNTKKLKNEMSGLRSFDKIINITTPKNTGADSGASGLGVSSDILNLANKAMDEYNKKLQNVKMQATEIRDKIMEWLGFTKIVDEKTGEVSFKFDHITSGTVLGGLAVGGIIFTGIFKIYKVLSKLGLLKFPIFTTLIKLVKTLITKLPILISKINPLTAIIIAIGAALVYTYTHSEKFRKKVNEMVSSVIKMFVKLKNKVVEIINGIIKVVGPLFNEIVKIVKPILKTFYAIFETTFGSIADIIKTTADIISHLIDGDWSGIFDDLKKLVSKLAGNFKDLFKKLFKYIGEFVPKALGKLGELLIWVGKLPAKFLKYIGEAIFNIYTSIITTDWLKMGEKILKGIVKGVLTIGKAVADFGSKLLEKIGKTIVETDWIEKGEEILKLVIKGLFKFKGKLTEWGIKFGEEMVKAVRNPIKTGKKAVVSSFGIFGGTIGKLLFKANGGVYEGGKWNPIQRYDGGGTPNTGQLFWARENGLPELVGTMGGHTAVMNNDQIVGSVSDGVYRATLAANARTRNNNTGTQQINIYLDKNHKLASYTLSELQNMAKSNGRAIEIR